LYDNKGNKDSATEDGLRLVWIGGTQRNFS